MSEQSWHAMGIEEAMQAVGGAQGGLSIDEAQRRLEADGTNALPQKRADHWGRVFVRQLKSPLIIVLVAAAVVSVWLGERLDATVIAAAVVFNTLVGFVQEYKANRALAKLRSLIQPRALVVREGKHIEIDARDLVVGDTLVLRSGDRIAADARVVSAIELAANESALTGESSAVEKSVDTLPVGTMLAERRNMVFAGTSVTSGHGLAVVVATGTHTELGKIATLVQETPEESTPLQSQLARLARFLAAAVLALVAFLFAAGLATGRSPVEMVSMSVALAVAAIPEGLAVSVTIILAIGMQRILKRKSLSRTLIAAETLGSVSVICTDKTGTITQGEMRVTHLATLDGVFDLSTLQASRFTLHDFLLPLALCNNATMDNGEIHGSQTERALVLALQELGVNRQAFVASHPRVSEVPFDSSRKYMITTHTTDAGEVSFLKGAWSHASPLFDRVFMGGKEVEIDDGLRRRIDEKEQQLAGQGLRLMALGQGSDPTHFAFLGFVGLRDPLRPQVKQQIEDARLAGVRTVLVTGDHPDTARAIAAEAGLFANDGEIITGAQLDAWTDDELQRRIRNITIFARVEPRHKIRIVDAWQARGEVVAMTGDGVNDAPALKAADIGIALGSGTEVAKQASDLVLLDNNLGTITAAIEEGRVIFDNIRKSTVYLLTGSFTEIVLIGGAIFIGLPIPLLPLHILWINLVADSFPNIGLTLEPAERDIMRRAPRKRGESVLNRETLLLVCLIGLITDLILFAFFWWRLGLGHDPQTVRSFMFAAVGIASLVYIFAVKSFRRSIFRTNPFSNPWLLVGVGIGAGLMILAFTVPALREAFEIVSLGWADVGLLAVMAVVKLVAIEMIKVFFSASPYVSFPLDVSSR